MAFPVGLVDLPSVRDPAVAMDEATKTVENPRQASLDNSNRGHIQIGRKGGQCQQGTEGRHSFIQLIVHKLVESSQNVLNLAGGAGGYNGQIVPVLCQEIWRQEVYGNEGCVGRRTRKTIKWKSNMEHEKGA